MSTAEAPATRPVVSRPYDESSERPYVWATVANSMVSLHGGQFAHRPLIADQASAILEASNITVSTYEGDDLVLGFAAWSQDRAIEFLYIRQSVTSRRGWEEGEWGLGLRTSAYPFTDAELRVSDRVIAALLGPSKSFTARRPIHPRVLEAVVHAGYRPMVVPRSI